MVILQIVFYVFSDGVVKSFEAESGRPVSTFYEHKGWVTDFMYWYVHMFM